MTSPNDFDRRVGAWLEDGPSRAPERTLEAALGHARAHPRRRDALAVLRRDPMSGRGRVGALRPLGLVAVLGLLLVAAFGVATVGGFFDRQPSVVPPTAPVASQTPAPSATPTGRAIPASAPPVIWVDLVDENGGSAFVEVTDQSGTLLTARSGTASEGAEVTGDIGVANLASDPASVVLTWVGSPCDTRHDLTIAPDGRTITVARAVCGGDSLGVARILVLTFDAPVRAAEVVATLQTSGG